DVTEALEPLDLAFAELVAQVAREVLREAGDGETQIGGGHRRDLAALEQAAVARPQEQRKGRFGQLPLAAGPDCVDEGQPGPVGPEVAEVDRIEVARAGLERRVA